MEGEGAQIAPGDPLRPDGTGVEFGGGRRALAGGPHLRGGCPPWEKGTERYEVGASKTEACQHSEHHLPGLGVHQVQRPEPLGGGVVPSAVQRRAAERRNKRPNSGGRRRPHRSTPSRGRACHEGNYVSKY